ncbi:MAG: enoyl-CoA hydratase/isomerase family protein [Xanthomonadales bacterium]|nr:enoyl-CoA hydratase/isomerase family protein [Xanthomonadales bacterium]
MSLKINHDADGIRTIQLARPPVNALDPELVGLLTEAVDAAIAEEASAIIIAGGPGVFSAGLDVPVLLGLSREEMTQFWRSLFGITARLARSPVPIAAAIDGHSPAGGAVLALFCDYRVMADGPFRIGLNEVEVGLPVPAWIQAALRRQIGARPAEQLLVTGALIESRQALAVGMVDALQPPGEVLAAARDWCRNLLALPRQAMLSTRRLARRDLDEIFTSSEHGDFQAMTDAWFGDETQGAMRALVARLKAGG